MKHPILIGAAFLALTALPAVAQDTTCPAGLACVDYNGSSLQINPADGPIQYLVVETDVTTITDFDGQSTSQTVKLAEFVQDAGKYTFVKVYSFERSGPFATATLGDTFGLAALGS